MKKLPRIISVFLLILVLVQPIIFAVSADNGSTIVYVTNTGYAYHRNGCSYLKSKNSITLMEATRRGYKPCSRCDPPIFNGILPTETEPPKETSSSGTGGYSGSGGSGGAGKGTNGSTGSGKTNSTKATIPLLSTSETEKSSVTKPEDSGMSWGDFIVAALFLSPLLWWIVKAIIEAVSDARERKRKKRKKYEEFRENLAQKLTEISSKADTLFEGRSRKLSFLRDERYHLRKTLAALAKDHGAILSEDDTIIIRNESLYKADVLSLNTSNIYHTPTCPSVRGKQHRCARIDLLTRTPYGLSPCSRCRPQYVFSWAADILKLLRQIADNKDAIDILESEDIPKRLRALNNSFSTVPKSFVKKKPKKKQHNRPVIEATAKNNPSATKGGNQNGNNGEKRSIIIFYSSIAACLIAFVVLCFAFGESPKREPSYTTYSNIPTYFYYEEIPTFDLDSLPKPTYPQFTELPPFSDREDGYIVCYKDMTIHKDINCYKIPDDAYCLEVDDISTYGSFDNCESCNP